MNAALTAREIELLGEQLRAWSGAQFQSVTGLQMGSHQLAMHRLDRKPPASDDLFYELHFYLGRRGGGARVLLIDLDRTSPQIWLLESEAEIRAWQSCPRIKRKRPMELFLRSHFVGQRLSNVESRGPGRLALQLTCEADGLAEIELSLVPRAPQFLARRNKDGRKLLITEFKPDSKPASETGARRESKLEANQSLASTSTTPKDQLEEWSRARELGQGVGISRQRTADFLEAWTVKSSGSAELSAAQVQDAQSHGEAKATPGVLRALRAVKAEIDEKTRVPWRSWADHIMTEGLEAPPQFSSVDLEQTWNQEIYRMTSEGRKTHEIASNFYDLAKKTERKLAGTRQRLALLEAKIAGKSQTVFSRSEPGKAISRSTRSSPSRAGAVSDPAEGVTNKSLLEQAEARGRSVAIAADLVFYIGRSAEDNLRLLRRAQSFDFWFHVRGRTGAHGILRRARGRVISEAEILACGRALIEQSLKKRALDLRGESFDVSLCEVRHVKPVKGAKGLVHFTHDRTILVKF